MNTQPSEQPESAKTHTNLLKDLRAKSKHVVVTEGLDSYINELLLKSESKEYKDYMNELMALEHSNMQVPLSEARFLESLVKLTQAKHILEIGTFRGFSAAFLARSLPHDGKLITCERDERSVAFIHDAWKKVGVESKIEFKLGQGLETLKSLEVDGPVFDLIFIDGDKGSYPAYVEASLKLLRPGGAVLIDNVLWAGLVADDEHGDNIGQQMKDFNHMVFETYGAQASLIPAWDGVIMIVK